MPNHYEWLMQPIDVQFLQKPKPIPSLPFKQIWVIDNYLPPSIHDSWYSWRFNSTKWGRQNRVIRNNKMRHLYWGESIYINISERGWETNGIERKYEKRNLNSSRWKYQADWKQNVASQQRIGYRNAVIDWFIHKLRQDFHFDWVKFQYCGFNGQTKGQDGTVHEDTGLGESCLDNLSFLYYDQKIWKDDWGGDLIFYNSEYHSHAEEYSGIPKDEGSHEIGRVQYKPNRLVIMNGAMTHRHPGPDAEYNVENQFPYRTSLVVRGDKVRLWKEQ